MEKIECQSCFKNKTFLECSNCKEAVCKRCACFIDATSFEFVNFLPENINGQTFCPSCYYTKAGPVLAEYNEILERAKFVNVYSVKQSSETSLIKRIEKAIKVKNCADKEETLMRLAFITAQKNFDTIVDVKITSEKVFDSKYKKLTWSGEGVPVMNKKKQT